MKDIKDYLHFYLGCEAVTVKSKPEIITGHIIDLVNGNFYHAKPILRPLSDMTEDELQECGNLVYDFSDDKSGLGLNDHRWEDFQTLLCAEQFHWLIKRHFDLFDLITDGLAIDKTKLPTNER